MKVLIIFFIVAICVFCSNSFGQKLFPVVDNTITIKTKNATEGNTDVIEVSLPAKTQSYVYRISIFKNGNWISTPSLFALLDSMGAKNVLHATDFRKFALPSSDNTSANGFIFSSVSDANNFFDKKEGWRACKNLLRLKNTCMSSQQCLGKKIYFGFSNGDVDEEIDVRLEVVSVME